MGLFTSHNFASASAAGTDWRDTARQVLELLGEARTEADRFNIGFLYMTDTLVQDAQSILTLFRSVTGIDHWIGAVGLGICGTGTEYVDEPAISAMIGHIPAQDFCIFPAIDLNDEPARTVLEPWLETTEPLMVLVHGDPFCDSDPAMILRRLEQMTGGFIAGGLSSSRTAHLQFADEIMQGGVSGIAFSQDIKTATMLSQGCVPLGPAHTITRCEDHVVMELDGQRAFDVFAADLRAAAGETASDHGDLSELAQGEVHVAFPIAGTDRDDYLVRNAMGIDPDKGWIAVAHNIAGGDKMLFVRRDHETVRADLSRALLELRTRVQAEQDVFAPKGALYVSCVARTLSDFGDGPGGEMKLVREVIGDVPLAGFYANGEISNHRLYGYTAMLVLFL